VGTRIDKAFEGLRRRGQRGFVAYLTAGDPSVADTVDIAGRLADAGVDILELGIPFSDPLADGRVNQDAAARALAAGATLPRILRGVRDLRRRCDVPIVLYSYLNPLCAGGFDRTVRAMADAGVDGLLILDLTIEESAPFDPALAAAGIDRIRLVTPTSPPARVRRIARGASGFVYFVSRAGVTGARRTIDPAAFDVLRLARRHTSLPLALGFGLSDPDQVREAARPADAVVVGSAIVQRFHDAGRRPGARAAAARWVGRLARAAHEAGS
jgi:tryptophan synthase alpha chain